MKETISQKLTAEFSPDFLSVDDESHGHSVAEGAESHFKVVMASSELTGLLAVKRHQRVYATLKLELEGSVHALALHLYTPEEWEQRASAPDSPACMGGSKG